MSSRVRTVLKVAGSVVALLALAIAGLLLWSKSAAQSRLAKTFETHRIDFPVPFPLTDAEVEELRAQKRTAETPPDADVLAGIDLASVARDRAIARGKHLVTARYVCIECHSADFGGGTMINDAPVGQVYGPNLTGGEGSRVGSFKVSDWDRIVRHGVRVDGTPAIMPSTDFAAMSDRELSDIIAYVTSLPKVNKAMPPRELGPVLNIMMATGKAQLSADAFASSTSHLQEPPLSTDPVAFGKHLAQACTGCHNAELTGGPIKAGPPDWAPAANLTQMADWKYEEFERVLRTGKRRDGSDVKVPMTLMMEPAKHMKDEEIKAIFTYLKTLPSKMASN